MASRSRHQGHDKYKSKISYLFELYADDSNTETQADNAKYLAVLVSGYLEQAIKEILLQYVASISDKPVSKYIEDSWPISKNMTTNNIQNILNQFDENWAKEFSDWLKVIRNRDGKVNVREDRKGDINSIVRWRNSIAHGKESNTTGVTLRSVQEKFSTIKDLVLLIEAMVKK